MTYSNEIEFGLQKKRVVLPAGIVNTSNIEDLLRSYVAASRAQADFDKLPIPYRAVATDMISGKMVVLKEGDLATAMRASMAIPGAFAPVMTEQYILSDGGMVRNIPVDVARDLCADVVIVVNLVEEEVKREKLQTATQLLGRSSDVMIVANENLQLDSLTARDIRIDVIMGDITTTDFERVPETVPLGAVATRKMAAQLAPLAVPADQFKAWRASVTAGQNIETRLADVQYKGMERVSIEYLKQRAEVNPGDSVDTAEISAEARRMSALQEFESVEYRLTGDPDSPTLEWWPQEKRWGPELPQVRPRTLRFRRRRPRVRGVRQAHADLAELAGRRVAQRSAARLLQQPVDQLLSAARRRAAILRRTEIVLDAIVGRRFLRQRATGALQVQRLAAASSTWAST